MAHAREAARRLTQDRAHAARVHVRAVARVRDDAAVREARDGHIVDVLAAARAAAGHGAWLQPRAGTDLVRKDPAIWQARRPLEARLTGQLLRRPFRWSHRAARLRLDHVLKVRPAARLAVALRTRARYETQLRAA